MSFTGNSLLCLLNLKYFTTENDFKKCRTCSVRIKFKDLHTHGTSLRTHMLKQHPELFETDSKQSKLPKISDFYKENNHELPALPKLDRVVITICSSKHVLPFDIVEDPIFQWRFNFSGFDRRTISQRVTELAEVELALMPNNYPVHQTLENLIKKFPVSEASVERAFSRHKLVHSRLRASLGVEKLDETLFIRYNFEVILKVSQKDKKPIELEKEIENWSSVYIDDLVEYDD